MIALRDIHGHNGKKAFKILEGREIPKHYLKHLDVKRLITENVIKDDKMPNKGKEKETHFND